MATTKSTPDPAEFATTSSLDRESLRALRDVVVREASDRRELSRAVASFGELEALDANRAARKGIGFVLLGRHDEAATCLEKAGDGGGPEVTWARAQAAEGRRCWSEAIAHWDALLSRDANDREALFGKAEAVALSGDAEAFEALVRQHDGLRDENDADALACLGLARELASDTEGAAALYEKALAVSADHPKALFRLGRLSDLQGEESEAVDLYRRLLELPGAPAAAAINLGCLLEDQNEYAQARDLYRRVLDEYPTEPRARLFLRDSESSLRMYFDEDQERREELWRHVLDTQVAEFELSVRSRNCLEKMEIHTLGDLVQRSEEELLQYKNFGDTSLSEIRQLLAERGLRLGMRIPQDLPPHDPPGVPAPAAGPSDVLARPISELELSIRARRCMEILNIQTLGDLVKRSKKELLACRNFGQTSLDEVLQKLQNLSLTLREDG